MSAETKKRVKVYSYNESAFWDDMGTGHVSVDFVERNNAFTVIVRSEEDGSVLLESKVLPDRTYQQQEDTMIVWTEDDSCDLAISFQEKTGCDDMWQSICEIQGRSPDQPVMQDFSEPELLVQCDQALLPPCELSKLKEIRNIINLLSSSHAVLVRYIEQEKYIPKLIELFHVCEDLDNDEGLECLYEIFTKFMFGNICQLLFEDDIILDVIGCLEYNPGRPHVRHRDHISKISDQSEIIPFTDPALLPKIHQTYRVQYIRDVLLPTPSLFEEHKHEHINSFLRFNKTEIVQGIQQDSAFNQKLFKELTDENTPVDRYRHLVELLRDIINFSLLASDADRTKLYSTQCSFGMMRAIEGMLLQSSDDSVVVPVAVDILQLIAEFNCSIPRDHILATTDIVSEDNQLLNIIISLLVDGEFVEIDVQLVGLIKTIVSPAVIAPQKANDSINDTTPTPAQTAVEKSLFLKHFYQHSIHILMAPVMAHTATDTISKDTSANAVLLSHILDILSACIGRHTYHISNYIIDKNLLGRVLVLMTSTHGHLVLSALRLCRRIVGLKDQFYNHYIIRNNLFRPIVKTFMANGQRYNLINSAIIEIFAFITQEKIKSLISYVVDNFMDTLDTVEYVNTFKSLKLVHEQEKDSQECIRADAAALKEGILHSSVDLSTRFRRDARELDEDEEAWFDNEEDFSSPLPTTLTTSLLSQPPTPPSFSTKSTPSQPSPFTHVSYSPRPSEVKKPPPGQYDKPPSESSNNAVMRSQALLILADYDEDSDEENEQEETPHAPKKQKL